MKDMVEKSSNIEINSQDYWQYRFQTDWEINQGREQSRFFSHLALKHLPKWLIQYIKNEKLSICDWGCALGDGTNELAEFFNGNSVTGIDFSEKAIEKARATYQNCKFLCMDFITNNQGPTYDVVFSSNVLEHFKDYLYVLSRIQGRAKKFLILLLPFREYKRIAEHLTTFDFNNIPINLINGWHLLHSVIIDAKAESDSYWPGEQILLIYTRTGILESLRLTLADISLISKVMNERALAERDKQITSLNQMVAERDEQIASLNQMVAERDGQITSLNQMVAERDGQIASLNQAIVERDEQIASLNQMVAERDGQITSLNQMVAERDGQIASLNQAIVERDEQVVALQKQLQDTWASFSWRITLPIRLIKRLAKLLFVKENRYQLAKNIYWHLPRTLQIWLSPLRQYIVLKRLMQSNNKNANKTDNEINDASLNWVDEANKAQRVAIIPCAFEFEELYNQRPINAALYFAKKGYFVIYVAWQWTSNEKLKKGCQKVKNGIYQVPLYNFLSALGRLNMRTDNTSFFLITFPTDHFVKSARCLRSKGFVILYDIMDDWECFADVGQATWYDKQLEHSLVLESDFVIAVSPSLAKKFTCLRRDIEVVGNGFSSNTLNEHMKFICIQEKKQRHETIVGYFGHLTDSWFDWNLLLTAAQQLQTIKFEIIGYGVPDWVHEKVEKISNIKLVGKVLPKDLHKYARHWSAGLIPFRAGKLSEAVDPIKVYEYLFFGLPVVVTGIRHLERYPLVRFAASTEEFIEAIVDVININMLAYQGQLEAFLNNCTWNERFSSIEKKIEKELLRRLYVN
ncbi:Methyltransferase type 11 [Desulfotomaculum nigrificans CO-1-SRB]|uniref:Methyltransferase type 11 n=1 Tax=Desulfotomaculum nigrificans (strain DSM 14880 / VKM B-2319 / CO-1-SRB) TaxID=868595 RepID=F6B5J6_DESCC|nr:methyltransferase domain-containing protein [Desulfotomaculum nigrificans]AEF95428.1 Methyltransferase type 11 [Desulfotomaculum nigrificans CO-1-SRB]